MGYGVTTLVQPRQTLYGFHKRSGDRAQGRDIPSLAKRFHECVGVEPGTLVPLYIVSRNYTAADRAFTLFVGDDGSNRGLEQEILPAGTYAHLELRPRSSLLWGLSVGRAKRWFYTRWLPESGYEAADITYELHTQKSMGRHPAVDLLFAVRKKQA